MAFWTLFVCRVAFAEAPESQTSTQTSAFIRSDIQLGYEHPFVTADPTRVGEFLALEPRPRGVGRLELLEDGFYANLVARFRHEEDFDGTLTVDARRWARIDLSFDRLPHRFQPDPLSNLGFNQGGVLEVDVASAQELKIARATIRPKLRVSLPRLPGVQKAEITARYRYLIREGHEQIQTIAHCPTCHVRSETRPLNQRTDEVQVQLDARIFEKLSVTYRHTWRHLEEGADTPSFNYPEPPELSKGLLPVFGEQPFAMIPERTQNQDRLAVSWNAGTLSASAIYAFTHSKNDFTNNKTSTHIAGLRLNGRFFSMLRAKASYRFIRIDPTVDESLQRAGHRAGLGLTFAPLARLSMEAGYEFDHLTRKGVLLDRQAAPGPIVDGAYFIDQRGNEVMTRHTVSAALSTWLVRRLRGSVRYRLMLTNNPLSTRGRQGSFAPATGNRPLENTPGIYPTLSSQPKTAHELRAEARWQPLRSVTLAPSYSLQLATGISPQLDEDSGVEGAPRRSTDHVLGVTATFAPSPWFHVNAAYHYREDHIQTDLYYGQVGGLREAGDGWVDIGKDSVYENVSHTWIAGAAYSPIEGVWLRASAVQSRGEASFSGEDITAQIGALSAMAIQTRSGLIGLNWTLFRTWRFGVLYRFDEYLARPTRLYDGRRHLVWLKLGWMTGGR